jgi:hypothetical protein
MKTKIHFFTITLAGIATYQLEASYAWVLGAAVASAAAFSKPEDTLKSIMLTGLLAGGMLWLALTWINMERQEEYLPHLCWLVVMKSTKS